MELSKGQIVRSKAGRDEGYFMAVVGTDGERCLVCDGKERPLSRPKAKNPKHLAVTASVLTEEEMATDRKLRAALAMFGARND